MDLIVQLIADLLNQNQKYYTVEFFDSHNGVYCMLLEHQGSSVKEVFLPMNTLDYCIDFLSKEFIKPLYI